MIFLRYERSYTNKHRWIAMKAYGYPTRAHKHSYKLRLLQLFISNFRGKKTYEALSYVRIYSQQVFEN